MADKINKHVLIVSEDPSTNKILRVVLEREDFDTEELNILPNIIKDTKTSSNDPDLIIYDLPWRHSKDTKFCACVEPNLIFKEIPRIVISTSLKDCTECNEYQTNECAYFQKPFSVSDLVAKVKDFTGIKIN